MVTLVSPESEAAYLSDLQSRLQAVRIQNAGPDDLQRHRAVAQASPPQGDAIPSLDGDKLPADITVTEGAVREAHNILEGDLARTVAPSHYRDRLEGELGTDCWSELGSQAQSSLAQADRLREQIAQFSDIAGEEDFALAVFAYCRALEMELYRRIFEPFKKVDPDAGSDWMSERDKRSADLILRFQRGETGLGMGQMAMCLGNLGCGESGTRHILAKFLRQRLSDSTEFCAGRYPRSLTKLALGYRNKAAHIDPLSEKQCAKARGYLLAEPRRLLPRLVELAPID